MVMIYGRLSQGGLARTESGARVCIVLYRSSTVIRTELLTVGSTVILFTAV